jgi:hypothetical protein
MKHRTRRKKEKLRSLEQVFHQALHETTIDVIGADGEEARDVVSALYNKRPGLCSKFPRDYIESQAKCVFDAEVPILSSAYTTLYGDLNRRYFYSSLPSYAVKAHYFVTTPQGYFGAGGLFINPHEEVMRIGISYPQQNMIGILLTGMAAIGAKLGPTVPLPEQGPEMERLWRAGAPITRHHDGKFGFATEAECAQALHVLQGAIDNSPEELGALLGKGYDWLRLGQSRVTKPN